MSKINDGGAAFPLSKDMALDPVTDLSGEDVSSGMSLRDWFAGQALAGMNASLSNTEEWPSEISTKEMARVAYAQADAMLSARSDQGGGNG